MTRKRSRSAQSFASEARHQFNELKSALQSAESQLGHLRSSLHVAAIRPPRGRIPGSRSGPSFLTRTAESSFGGFFSGQILSGGGGLLDDMFGGNDFANAGGGSFSQSATQFAAKLFDAAQRGQRIR